jgi:uncharacterized protein (DUF342 family)
MPTPDERIDKLTELFEKQLQLEFTIIGMMERITGRVEKVEQRSEEHEERMNKYDEMLQVLIDIQRRRNGQ